MPERGHKVRSKVESQSLSALMRVLRAPKRRSARRGACVALCMLALSASAYAGQDGAQAPGRDEDDQPWALTLQVENDFFLNDTDRDFTNGLKLTYAYGAPRKATGLLSGVSSFLTKLSPLSEAARATGRLTFTAGLGQNIYSPDDITIEEIVPEDRPWAGYSYLEFGTVAETETDFESLKLELGIIGPASLAGRTQRFWHRFINSPRPAGWENQLRNEPTLNLYYTRGHRFWLAGGGANGSTNGRSGALQVDFLPHVTAALGTVYTYGGVGGALRIGTNLSRDTASPPRIQPSLPGSEIHTGSGVDFYVFAGVEGRAVARNALLDGTLFSDDPHTVNSKTFVGDVQAGGVLLLGPWRLALTQTWRSREYDTSDIQHSYSAITLTRVF